MTQERTLEILKTGANVFLTGEPGAGKTYVLNRYVDWLTSCEVPVAITASTGIAATHIGGITIHSWSGIGARDTLTPRDVDYIASNEKTVRRIKKAKVLVIDEISMLDGRVLDMVETVCRTVRQSGDAFGGLQIIVVGDFFQLPPIAGRGEMSRFAFESNAWERAKFLTCYLTEQHRQEDELFLGLLSAIRKNDVDESHYTLLSEQTDIGFPDIEPTKLFTHNSDVESMNLARLRELNTRSAMFNMEAKGNKQLVENLIKNCLSPQVLELRLEAMVMCTKNNFEAGYVNGTMGRVVDFDTDDGFPIIETGEGKRIKMESQSWSVMDESGNKVLAEITQVPLRLAWAITVHKSQGMSLDAAEIDLRNAFTYGQGYVAISRVRSLAGMKMIGLNSQALLVDPRVVHKDEHFRKDSEDAEYAFSEMEHEEVLTMQKNFVNASGGKWTDKETRRRGGHVEAVQKESTYEVTKSLLFKNMNTADIARERKMALSTIWTHIEKLAEDGEVAHEHVVRLVPENWHVVYPRLTEAFQKHGTEKLKPVHEACREEYDYDLIRLGRIVYTLEEKEKTRA